MANEQIMQSCGTATGRRYGHACSVVHSGGRAWGSERGLAAGSGRQPGAPGRGALETPAATLVYPGCGPTIQDCLDGASAGSTLVIQPYTYITNVTLSGGSLTGAASATVILQAPARGECSP